MSLICLILLLTSFSSGVIMSLTQLRKTASPSKRAKITGLKIQDNNRVILVRGSRLRRELRALCF